MEKLPLKKDALNKLNLPIEVKSGFIGKLKIQIPFRHLKSQPWVVQVDQLYLIAGPSVASPVSVSLSVCVCVCVCVCVSTFPVLLTQYDEEAECSKAIATKRRKLDAMEEQWRVRQYYVHVYPSVAQN